VIERLSVVGGRTSAIAAEGFKFDLGPTFFLFPRVLEEIFAAAGASLCNEVEMVRLDPHYRITFGAGGEIDATAEVSRMEAQIAQLSPFGRGRVSTFPRRESGQASADGAMPGESVPRLG
jgi:phytoene desaturase